MRAADRPGPGHPDDPADLSRSPTVRVPSSGGVAVAVRDLGGEGPPALLVHATSLHGLVWRPFARRLAGRHCLAPDIRGHGATPGGGDQDWEGVTDDVLAVVDALDLGGCVGVGHSMGGAALLRAEARRPGTFRALWVYEPIVFPPLPAGFEPDNPLVKGALRRRRRFPDRAAARANFAAKPPFSSLDPDALDAYVEAGFVDDGDGVVLACAPEVEAETYRMGGHHDTWDRLGELRCGVAVVWGGDGGHPAAVAPRIVERIPHATAVHHPDLGHFGPLEAPSLLAAEADAALHRV